MVSHMRKIKFANGEFYHIFNRGTDKRTIFSDKHDFQRFLISMNMFNCATPIGSIYEQSFIEKPKLGGRTTKLVNIICYCLNINHYHLILEQVTCGGISEFIKRLSGGYTRYFNIKNRRNGVLFQGKFKAAHIDSNEYLLHASAYVNLNNRVHKLGGRTTKSSWEEYVGNVEDGFCKKNIIVSQFKNKKEYKNFAESSLLDILTRKQLAKEMKQMLLE